MSGNVDACISILEDLGYTNISQSSLKNELRFSREVGRNPSAMRLKIDTLKFVCFSTNEYGNLYTLIMKNKGLDFPGSLHYAAKHLGLSSEAFSARTKYPFHGFYKGIMKELSEPEFSMPTYDNETLLPYSKKFNLLFLQDGISFSTQEKFHVGFDLETCRITVPEYTLDGQLCGVMGRLNDKNCEKQERWIPLIPCSRSLTLYGYHQNYSKIQEKNLVVIGESEKFVQQLDSMGCHVGLALCGNNVSSTQAKYIKGLWTNRIVLALDEGLPEEYVRSQAEKLVAENAMLKNQVGYIWDKDNEVLSKDSKASPADLGKVAFTHLMKKHIIWL